MDKEAISKALQEGRAFKVSGSCVFAAQIPDESVGCSGSRCTHCDGQAAYCDQICRYCKLPFIGPVGFPQFTRWKRLGSIEKLTLVDKVYRVPNRGRLEYANVKNVPLTLDEAKGIVILTGNEAAAFYEVHKMDPRNVTSCFTF